jgi:hypothetical protein
LRDRCTHCGQVLPNYRYGARLGPLAARIVDAVRRAGPDGIAPADLFEMIYADRPGRKRAALSGYISLINTSIEPAKIRNVDGHYVLIRRLRLRNFPGAAA